MIESEDKQSPIDAFAIARGYSSWKEWNRAQIGKFPTKPDAAKGAPIGSGSNSLLSDGEASAAVFGRTFFSEEDLKAPALQRFIQDPETPLDELATLFVHTTGVVPDEFAVFQYTRTFYPESFVEQERNLGLRNSYGEWQCGMIDLVIDSGYRIREVAVLARNGDQVAAQRLGQFRSALLQLNDLLVRGQNPRAFDWQNFPAAPSQDQAAPASI